MKFIIKFILIILLAWILQPYFSWWIVIALAFLISALLKSSGGAAFFSSFLGIAILWFWKAWEIDQNTHSIMTNKIAALFGLSEAIHLIIISAIIGGLAAGFGALTGHTFKKLFEKKKPLYY